MLRHRPARHVECPPHYGGLARSSTHSNDFQRRCAAWLANCSWAPPGTSKPREAAQSDYLRKPTSSGVIPHRCQAQMLCDQISENESAPLRRVTGDSDHLRYLAFVDGLRAISILAVVAFHVGAPGFSGGFVGVDIFFVISGFLIINQIKDGLSSDRFSILSFYARRVLRILPPLLLVLLATYAVAPFVLPTTAIYWDFIPSAALSPLLVSNIVFLLTQGYFDISSIEKPLLHTWTLSVEEQFYLWAPILLALVFRLGRDRFGILAATIGMVLGCVSLAGTIAQSSTNGQTAAFYLSHWRAWEFLAGGFIGGGLVAAVGRLPRVLVEIMGWAGIGCVGLAIHTFHTGMPYPSSSALLPVAGAAAIILCGLAQPRTTVARLLSLRWLVAIGLVSYSWYLWHWPILSFIRIARLSESSLLIDGLGGGALGFVLACVTYRYVEQPIRRWRRSPGNMKRPGHIVLAGVAACLATAAIGGSSALAGYWSTNSFLAARYGVEGRGVLHNGCQRLTGPHLPDHCFEGRVGMLLGDSHASVLSGSFAKNFDLQDIRLVSIAGPGCHPLLFVPPEASRLGECASRIPAFNRLLVGPPPVAFVIISANWGYSDQSARLLSDLIVEFDPVRTRILLIGQVPTFLKSSLECVVLSDRFGAGRGRCVRRRSDFEAERAAMADVLRALPGRFQNVRYIDPIDTFCDDTVCRPFRNDDVFYSDTHHVLPSGADRIYDAFKNDFLWLAGRE
jgi:peptidoglycan/LPS O-acetylase OafA/YrhL